MPDDINKQFGHWLDDLRGMQRYRKVFITGCPKSGTTWLVKSLNGHPQIVAEGEGRFGWRLFNFMEQATTAFNADQKGNGGTAMGLVDGDDLTMLMRAAGDRIMHRYIQCSGKAPGKVRIVADKTPQHIVVFQLLRKVFPESRFINIVRDPRDVATSALFHMAKTDTRPREQFIEYFITQVWKAHVDFAMLAEKQLGPGAMLTVRYEDFHSDERGVLERCLRLMGADVSDPTVLACQQAGRFETLSGGRRRGEQDASSFYRSGTVGDWRNHISPEVAARCCVPVAHLMQRYGYHLEQPGVEVTLHVKPESASVAA